MSRWLGVVVVLLIDQLTKGWVRQAFAPGESRSLLGPILHLTYVQNTGAAFGLLRGHVPIVVVVSLVVGAWVIVELKRLRHGPWTAWWPLTLILGGAIGNLIDRVRLGYVVDFLDLRVWPVFNVADSCITIGVTWMILQMVLTKADRHTPQRS